MNEYLNRSLFKKEVIEKEYMRVYAIDVHSIICHYNQKQIAIKLNLISSQLNLRQI